MIVNHGMLAWKGQMHMHTGRYENGTFAMEAIYGRVDCTQSDFTKDGTPDQITEVEECAQCTHHAWRHMANYGWQVYLPIHKYKRYIYMICTTYLPSSVPLNHLQSTA